MIRVKSRAEALPKFCKGWSTRAADFDAQAGHRALSVQAVLFESCL